MVLWLRQISWLVLFTVCSSPTVLETVGLSSVLLTVSSIARELVTAVTNAIGLGSEPEEMAFHTSLTQWFAICLLAAGIILPLVPTYGKHSGGSNNLIAWCFGPGLPPNVAWVLQEAPAFVVHCVLFLDSLANLSSAQRVLCGLFLMHYWHRSFEYPLKMRGGKPMPTVLFLSAATFCFLNGYLQGRGITHFSAHLQQSQWLFQPQFVVGVMIFISGRCINLHSDKILRNLRKPGEQGYKIPYGGMFGCISAANLWGEMIEWIGFALACGNAPGSVFAFATIANLVPRAISTHNWYCNKFKEEYSQLNRKALVPFIF